MTIVQIQRPGAANTILDVGGARVAKVERPSPDLVARRGVVQRLPSADADTIPGLSLDSDLALALAAVAASAAVARRRGSSPDLAHAATTPGRPADARARGRAARGRELPRPRVPRDRRRGAGHADRPRRAQRRRHRAAWPGRVLRSTSCDGRRATDGVRAARPRASRAGRGRRRRAGRRAHHRPAARVGALAPRVRLRGRRRRAGAWALA